MQKHSNLANFDCLVTFLKKQKLADIVLSLASYIDSLAPDLTINYIQNHLKNDLSNELGLKSKYGTVGSFKASYKISQMFIFRTQCIQNKLVYSKQTRVFKTNSHEALYEALND